MDKSTKTLSIIMGEQQLETPQQLEIPLNYEEILHSSSPGFPNSMSQEILDNHSDFDFKGKKEKSPPNPLRKRRIGLAITGILVLGTLGVFGLRIMTAPKVADESGKKGNQRDQVTPVTTVKAIQKTVPIQLQAIGNVQAASTVAVTPQAGGKITGVYFKKGQDVRKGDLLFTLDNRSQMAALQQAQGVLARDQTQVQQARAALAKDLGLVRSAEATLARDEAQAEFARSQSDRYNNLYSQGAISQDQAQQYTTNSRVSEATLQADREAIANALAVVEGDKAAIASAEALVITDEGAYKNVEVQSSYTEIYAPIDGRAGNILVTEGNVVQANNTNPLVTIAQINPIQVSFAIPEANLLEVQKRMQNGRLKVDVTFVGNTSPISGTLTFINNTVDSTTGTIQLIGDFSNGGGKLFPGQFVNTTLTLSEQTDAIVVPAQAVQNGPNGQFVFVVNPVDESGNATVTNVPVVAISTIDGLNVIQKGVKPGDQVVIDGQANLVSGSKVLPKAAADLPRSGGTDKPGTTDPTKPGRTRKSTTPSPDKNPSPAPGGTN